MFPFQLGAFLSFQPSIFPGVVVSASERPELPVPGAIHPSELFRRGKEEPGEAAEAVQGKMCFHHRKSKVFFNPETWEQCC